MKKFLLLGLSGIVLLFLNACGGPNSANEADYNLTSFKNALGNGEKLKGKTVVFKISKEKKRLFSDKYILYPDDESGINFISNNDPQVAKGDLVIVKVGGSEEKGKNFDIIYSNLTKIKSLSNVSIKNSKAQPKTLNLDIKDGQAADKDGKIKISGRTLPHSEVYIGMGVIGDSVVSDDDGNFLLDYTISESEQDKTLKITATIGDKIKSENYRWL